LEVLERLGYVLWIKILNIVVPTQPFVLTATLHSLRKERRPGIYVQEFPKIEFGSPEVVTQSAQIAFSK